MSQPLAFSLDARTKLGVAAILIMGLLLVDDAIALAVFCGLLIIMAAFAQVSFRIVVLAWLALWPVLLLTVLIHGLVAPSSGRILVSFGGLTMTTAGLSRGVLFAFRFMLFVFISRLALHIGRGEEYARALARLLSPLRRFRLPVGEIELVLGVAFRLIPILEREAGRLILAHRARGIVTGWVGKIRQLPAILVPLFIGAFRRADALAIAMEARGFAVGAPRSSYIQAHFGLLDLLALAFAVGGTALAIVLS